jgi:hypothetical protein
MDLKVELLKWAKEIMYESRHRITEHSGSFYIERLVTNENWKETMCANKIMISLKNGVVAVWFLEAKEKEREERETNHSYEVIGWREEEEKLPEIEVSISETKLINILDPEVDLETEFKNYLKDKIKMV